MRASLLGPHALIASIGRSYVLSELVGDLVLTTNETKQLNHIKRRMRTSSVNIKPMKMLVQLYHSVVADPVSG